MESELEPTATCGSRFLGVPSSNDASDLMQKLMLFVTELNMLLAQELGKVRQETWWELEELPHVTQNSNMCASQ